ncbi:MAG: hypothetical protein ACLFM9_01500, partial [Candidatus Aenigmatarchaeota archaeon]
LITEVKNSTNEKTIRNGIKETLEYIVFLKIKGGEYVFDDKSGFLGDGWSGILVIQDLDDVEYISFDKQRNQPIKILQASDFIEDEDGQPKKQIKSILDKFLG